MTRRKVLTASALAGITAGCGSRTTTATQVVEKPDLTIGAIQSVTAAGLYVAAAQGFFTAAGLRVKILPTTGSGPAMAELINGTFDISFGNYVSFIDVAAKGVAKLRILAEGNNAVPHEFEIVVPARSPISSVAGLRGKVIGVNALQNVATLIVSSVLAENNVPPSSVKFTAVPFPEMAAALQARRVDAAWLAEPFVTEAETRYGVVEIADGDQGATQNFPISGYAVTQAWAQRYPGTAAAFVQALDKGQQLADTSRPAVEQALRRYISISHAAAALVVTGTFPTGVNQVQIQRVADIMHQFGMLKTSFNVAPMIG